MATLTLDNQTKDQWLVLKEELGYSSVADLLGDAADYLEEHIEEFDAAFPDDEEDEE